MQRRRHHWSVRYVQGLSALFVVVFLLAHPVRSEEPDSRENSLKAEVVVKITKFVTWPDTAFASKEAPLVIGVLAGEPTWEIWAAMKERTSQGRPVVIRRLENLDHVEGIHVLAVDNVFKAMWEEHAEENHRAAILTISDIPSFAERYGMFCLYVKKNKIQYDINRKVAKEAQLKIGVKVLRRARKVIQS